VLAAAQYDGPVYLRLSRAEVPVVYRPDMSFVIGKAIVVRPGKDITLFAHGYMLAKALEAAEGLAQEGIQAEVIDMHTVKPLDSGAVIQSVTKTGAAVTVEEHTIYGGLGSAVAEVLAKQRLGPLEMVGIADQFGESGAYEALLTKFGLDKTAILAAVRKALAAK
jgi:transketolase